MSAVPSSFLPPAITPSYTSSGPGLASPLSTPAPAPPQPAAIAGTCDRIDPSGRVPGAGQPFADQSVWSAPPPSPAPNQPGSLDVLTLGAGGSFGAGSGQLSLQVDLRTGDAYGCYTYSLGPSTPGLGASAQLGTATRPDGREATSTADRRSIIGGDSQTVDGGIAVSAVARSSNSSGSVTSLGLQTPGAGVQTGNGYCVRITPG